jgi:hypothetical protein
MKNIFLLLCAGLLFYPTATQANPPVKKIALKVLYVGGTSDYYTSGREIPADVLKASVDQRMKSFEQFLNEYFTSVTVIHADDYTQELSYKYDVTVMDGLPKPTVPLYQDRAKGVYLYAGCLSDDFDRPMLTIGEMGDRIGRRIGTKNDWY